MTRASIIVAVAVMAWAAPVCAQDGTPSKGEAPASSSPTAKGDGLVHGLIRGLVDTAVKAAGLAHLLRRGTVTISIVFPATASSPQLTDSVQLIVR